MACIWLFSTNIKYGTEKRKTSAGFELGSSEQQASTLTTTDTTTTAQDLRYFDVETKLKTINNEQNPSTMDQRIFSLPLEGTS